MLLPCDHGFGMKEPLKLKVGDILTYRDIDLYVIIRITTENTFEMYSLKESRIYYESTSLIPIYYKLYEV